MGQDAFSELLTIVIGAITLTLWAATEVFIFAGRRIYRRCKYGRWL